MIEAMLKAQDRDDFVSAVRALDRVLLSGDYVIPLFHLPRQWVAYWSELKRPEKTPLYGYQIDAWWIEPGRSPASETGRALIGHDAATLNAIERKREGPASHGGGPVAPSRQPAAGAVTALADPPNRRGARLAASRNLHLSRGRRAPSMRSPAFFIELGLEPGDRIVVQLPNVALAPLTIARRLARRAHGRRLPMLWRRMEIAKVCEELAPKALIGVSRFVGEKRDGDALRDRRVAAVGALRARLRPRPARRRHLARRGAARADGQRAPVRSRRARFYGRAMITFTARAGAPLVPVFRGEDDLLAQGAMTVLALSLDAPRRDPQPLPADRAWWAFARAHALADQRGRRWSSTIAVRL